MNLKNNQEIIKKYINNLHSIRKIARDLNIDRQTIRKILTRSKINIRNHQTSIKLTNQKHIKIPFNNNSNEKAYLIGLVKGDLTPIKKSKYTLRLSVSSGHKSFINYLKEIFIKYGPVHVYPAKNKNTYQWQLCADLDLKSFYFLLNARKSSLPKFNKDEFFNFLAGLIDTDGSVYLRKTGKYVQYMLRIFSQDLKILKQINNYLHKHGFNSVLYRNSKKGETRNHFNFKITYNRDYYILELSIREEVYSLLKLLPLKHPEKIERKNIILDLLERKVSYHKDTSKMLKLRNKIKEEVRKDINEAKTEYLNKQKRLSFDAT